MSRPVVQLHTLDQWLAVEEGVRRVIVQHIRLKSRLEHWRREFEGRKLQPLDEPKWVPCRHCSQTGWVKKEPRYPGIHPSQLPHSCLLKIYWEMEGKEAEKRDEARKLFTYDIGHAFHHMVQGYGQMGAWGDPERYTPEKRITQGTSPVCDELMLEGSADADHIMVIDDILNAPIFELGLVHEYKTIKKENYEKLTRPKPEHLKQANVYARALNRPIVVYLYFNKNDSSMSDYPVPFDFAHWQPLEEKAKYLVGCFDRQQPPEANPGHYCTECGFQGSCPAYQAYKNQKRRA